MTVIRKGEYQPNIKNPVSALGKQSVKDWVRKYIDSVTGANTVKRHGLQESDNVCNMWNLYREVPWKTELRYN